MNGGSDFGMKRPSTKLATAIPAPPLQKRSREKLERVLSAAEELLSERLFEQLTMADVAQCAGVAVGTIYTRFRTKEDLLPALFARHDEAVAGRVGSFLIELAKKRSLRARIDAVVGFAVDYHRKHRGLLRALTMYVRAHPESVPAGIWSQRAAQYRAVAELVAGSGRGIVHDQPVEATEFALGVVNSVCREQVLFDDVTPLRGRGQSLAKLERRLADNVHRDLAGRIR